MWEVYHLCMKSGNRLEMGARIVRFARERHGLTQEELSERSGISQSLISRYERGLVEPSLATVQRLLNAAGAVMTIDVDGSRMIDTTRFPTEEEAAWIEEGTRKYLGRAAAAGGMSMAGVRLTGRKAFRQPQDGAGS
jgi:transcriptional regulator with XRE-family HTH domain